MTADRRRFRPSFKSFIAAFLSAAMLGETAFAYTPETSFWTDRKTSKPVLLASAASAPAMPRPEALSRVLTAIAPTSLTPSTRALSAHLPAGFLSQVQVKKVVERPGQDAVILLEDVHQNVEAQTHISAALRALGAEAGDAPVAVALEGATGGFRFDAYHHFPDPAIATAVADSFLASGDLGGPSHAGFMAFPTAGARGLRFSGADDAVHYARNVAAYHAAARAKAAARAALDARAAALSARRPSVFSRELLTFDAAAERHHRGEMPLADFAALLARLQTGAADPVLSRFLDASRRERELDLAAIERERRAVLEKLVARLSDADTQALVQLTIGYREGAVSFGGYYAALDGFCGRCGVDLTKTPHFQSYLRYVLLSDGIDAAALFASVDAAETAVYARLATTADARALAASLRQLRRAARIVDFALSSPEWIAYKANRAALTGVDLTAFESFYEEADARDVALVAAATAGKGLRVLVSGGFHTEAVADALRRAGRSVIVCSPRLTRVDGSASAYLSVFDREKTPLERIFAGEKLFLAGVPAGAVAPLVRMPDPTSEMANDARALTAHANGDVAAADRAAGELGAPAAASTSRDGDHTTVTSDVAGKTVVTEILPAGAASRHRGAPASRRTVGKLQVLTFAEAAVSGRSFSNRVWLSLPGVALAVGSAIGIAALAATGVQSTAAIVALTVASVLGAAWSFIFLREALIVLRARNGELRHPLIVEMHGHDFIESNARAAVATVVSNRIVLNPYYFDFVRNTSRLTPAQQRSILQEELRHLRYRRERGLIENQARTIPSLVREEFFVNILMPVSDFFSGREDTVSGQRHEMNVDLSLVQERARLRALLEKLTREKAQPGSQEFEQVVFISDQHGTIDVFDDLLMDSILRSVPLQGIERVDPDGEWTPARIDGLFAKAAGALSPQPDVLVELNQPIGQQADLLHLKGRAFLTNLRALTDGNRFPPDVVARAQQYIDAGFDFHLDPDAPMNPQIERFGVRLSDLKGKIFFHNLGDFMDRGPFGIKIYRRSRELIEAKLSDLIVGNHDLWTMMNLMAIHLPFYEGYDFHGYNDGPEFTAEYGEINEVLAAHHRADDRRETARNRTWWATKLAEYVKFHEDKQKATWTPNVDARMKTFWADAKPLVDKNPAVQRIWGEVRGNFFDTDVYTGTRSVGQMSYVWWRDTLNRFKQARAAMPAPTNDEERKALAAWDAAIAMIESEIVPVVKADLETALKDGKWWWRAFEAMNNQNYTSAEWWAKDWVFHDKWGPSVITELNAIRKKEVGEGAREVTNANYLDNDQIIEVASFFKKNFTLFERDDQQNTYMHAFLPVDMNKFLTVGGRLTDQPNPGYGEFFFTYKGVEYRGKGREGFKSIWDGLSILQEDVRRGQNLSELMEALQLVNSWYADNTTLAKPTSVADVLKDIGEDRLAELNGFNRLFTGHIPFYEFNKQKKKGVPTGFRNGGRIVFIDHGMGERFGSRGGYALSSPNRGLTLYGRESEKDNGILANPRTMLNESQAKGAPITALFENPGIDRATHLDTLILNVGSRLDDVERTLSGGLAARSLWNRIAFTVAFVAGLAAFGIFGDPLHNVWTVVGLTVTAAGSTLFGYQALAIAVANIRGVLGATPGPLHWAAARYADLTYPHTEAGVVLGGQLALNRGLLAQMPLRQQRSVIAEELRHLRYQRHFGLLVETRSRLSYAIEEIAVNLIMPVLELFRPDPEIVALSRPLSHEQQVINELTPSTEQIQTIAETFGREIRDGMAGHPRSLEMIRTEAKLPRGNEREFTIAIDWGGSTARLSVWELRGNGEVVQVATLPDYIFNEADKRDPRGLYPMLVDRVNELIGRLPAADRERKFNVVVGFAFPPSQWSKGWTDPNGLKPMSQTEIKDSLNAEFQRRGGGNLNAEKGENDTVGPMVMETYVRRAVDARARPATISVIQGTGHNIAALIDGAIWNFESGAFDGVKTLSTSMDAETDRNQSNPGEHLLEKMVAGGFLGEIFRSALSRLNRETGQFAWNPTIFNTPNAVPSQFVSALAATGGDEIRLQTALLAGGVPNATRHEAVTAYRIAEAIIDRSARLVAMELAATIRVQDPQLLQIHIIPIEGSVYEKAPRYPERLHDALAELLGPDAAARIQLVSNKGREGAGTAVMAATAGAPVEPRLNRATVDEEDGREIFLPAAGIPIGRPDLAMAMVDDVLDLPRFFISRNMRAISVTAESVSAGSAVGRQKWTFTDPSGEYAGEVTVVLTGEVWTLYTRTSVQQLTSDLFSHVVGVLALGGFIGDTGEGTADRSVGNRIGLAAAGAGVFLASVTALWSLSGVHDLSFGVVSALLAAAAAGLAALAAFARQAASLNAARQGNAPNFMLIPELHGGVTMRSDRNGPAASVIDGRVRLNAWYFDLSRGRSTLTPAEQRSLLREEERHIRFQRAAGLAGPRSRLSLAVEEFIVNIIMPLNDLISRPRLAIPVGRDIPAWHDRVTVTRDGDHVMRVKAAGGAVSPRDVQNIARAADLAGRFHENGFPFVTFAPEATLRPADGEYLWSFQDTGNVATGDASLRLENGEWVVSVRTGSADMNLQVMSWILLALVHLGQHVPPAEITRGDTGPRLNADAVGALGLLLAGFGIPAGLALLVGSAAAWLGLSAKLGAPRSAALGVFVGLTLIAPVAGLVIALAAGAVYLYGRGAPSREARQWIAEGRRDAAAAARAGSDAALVDALDAAAPRGLYFGRATANDLRNAALTGFARAAARETSPARRALQWASLAGYRRAVESGTGALSAVDASQAASAGVSTRVEVYHFNQVGEAALPSEIAEFRALIVRARADRAEGRLVSVVAAVSGELPDAIRAELDELLRGGAGFTGLVRVTEDLRSDDGVAYSYEKLLARAAQGSDLDAVRALVSGSYDNAAFLTYSKIPSQFLADGRLRAIWTVLANIGAGWAPVPVDTLIRAAQIIKQQA